VPTAVRVFSGISFFVWYILPYLTLYSDSLEPSVEEA